MSVAALFVRADSVYKTMAGVDAWDKQRDARKWIGGTSLVAHPPCAQWGGLRAMAKVDLDERNLANFSVGLVRKYGGVLEHPGASVLWGACGVVMPGAGVDAFGGWSVVVDQFWWGHDARKRTLLYIVGVGCGGIPPLPFVLGDAPRVCGRSGRRRDGTRNLRRSEISKSARERTPVAFAAWLVEVAERAGRGAYV